MIVATTWRRLQVLCLVVALAPIIGSYVWLAFAHETVRLAHVIVHESGRYTLAQTIFYFSHFLREIPVDIVMALFAVAAFEQLIGPVTRPSRTVTAGALLTAVALGGTAMIATVSAHGAASARLDLLQFRTTDDAVSYGSHWHYHFASTLWFAAGAPVALRLLAAIAAIRLPEPPTSSAATTRWMAWGAFLSLTLVLGVSPQTVTSVRYTGHQARELLTHVPVTMPFAFAALAALRWQALPQNDAGSPWTRIRRALGVNPWQTAAAFAIPLMLAAITLSGDPMEEGQAEQGVAAMVAGHVFEHTLDYALTVAVAIFVAGASGRRRSVAAASAAPGLGA